MALEIIGAGFGRTGTKSLKTAIDMLGLGPCYHMTEVVKNEGHRYRWAYIGFYFAIALVAALFIGYAVGSAG